MEFRGLIALLCGCLLFLPIAQANLPLTAEDHVRTVKSEKKPAR